MEEYFSPEFEFKLSLDVVNEQLLEDIDLLWHIQNEYFLSNVSELSEKEIKKIYSTLKIILPTLTKSMEHNQEELENSINQFYKSEVKSK